MVADGKGQAETSQHGGVSEQDQQKTSRIVQKVIPLASILGQWRSSPEGISADAMKLRKNTRENGKNRRNRKKKEK
jgi:hypothetical protein